MTLSLVALTQFASAADSGILTTITTLAHRIPPAPALGLTGSQFVAHVVNMDPRQRERAILKEILSGNIPEFLRKLVPVQLKHEVPGGKTLKATIFVMPEYLAIGPASDFLRIPMNLQTAAEVASRTGFILPTRKMVNAIYDQSAFHYSPEPMAAGPQMRSTEYYRIHNQKIEEQSKVLGISSGALVSGHKKDVVITRLLSRNPSKIAIYGWHRLNGIPIQSLTTVHGVCYADYSHGIRLVSDTAMVNGKPVSVYELLKDPEFAKVISDEGSITDLKETLAQVTASQPCGELIGAEESEFLRSENPNDN